jgi:hypothetical protein
MKAPGTVIHADELELLAQPGQPHGRGMRDRHEGNTPGGAIARGEIHPPPGAGEGRDRGQHRVVTEGNGRARHPCIVPKRPGIVSPWRAPRWTVRRTHG